MVPTGVSMKIKKAYTYDDVLLVPKKSTITSRSSVDMNTTVDLGKDIVLKVPVLTANMVNVTGGSMLDVMSRKIGGMAVMHRFYDYKYDECSKRYSAFLKAIDVRDSQPGRLTLDRIKHIAVSFGVTEQERKFFDFFEANAKEYMKIVCVDVAHGHHTNALRMVHHIKMKLPEALIIAGNVATYDGAKDLAAVGADVIKVGIGPGSLCTTRVETGNGVPQLTALEDARKGLNDGGHYDVKIVADGGIKRAGDVVKALCFADAVMLGNMLAGCPEAPGDIITISDKKYKQYAGSSTHKSRNVEGVIALVPTKPSVETVIERLMEGLRSGMSYQGVSNLIDLKKNPVFVEISNAGLVESKPHDVFV